MATGKTIVYLQTLGDLSTYLPECYGNLDVINVSSFHFGFDGNTPYIHINDTNPDDPSNDMLWTAMKNAQQNNIQVFAMVGGAGGAYTQLFAHYDLFYPLLKSTIQTYGFQGVDLDVEEAVTLANMQQLIGDLRRDFPTNFTITAAPVCSALQTGHDPFAGIDWSTLKSSIDWFNVQFYSSFGTLATPSDYNKIIAQGYAPSQIVGGALTNNSDGSGYVHIAVVAATLKTLTQQHGSIAGTMGWEFYNANNIIDQPDPAGWCAVMRKAVS